MKWRVLGLGGVVLLVALATSLLVRSAGSNTDPLTEAEARAHLARLVTAGQARDFDQLCSLAGAVLNCRTLLAEAGRDAAPTGAPRVLSATYHEPQTKGGTPGWVLVVAGTDGRQRPYRTEVLIFRDDENRVVATNAVYWSNARITFGDPSEGTTPG